MGFSTLENDSRVVHMLVIQSVLKLDNCEILFLFLSYIFPVVGTQWNLGSKIARDFIFTTFKTTLAWFWYWTLDCWTEKFSNWKVVCGFWCMWSWSPWTKDLKRYFLFQFQVSLACFLQIRLASFNVMCRI